MRKTGYRLMAAMAGVGLLATGVLAAHNEPEKAKSLKNSLITAYEECTGPNDSTVATPLPACHPSVRSDATCGFSTKSSGTLALQANAKDGSLKINAKAKGLDPGCEGALLCPVATIRSTTDDCKSSDPAGCTTADTAFDIGVFGTQNCGTVSGGQVKIKTTVTGSITPGKNTGVEIIGCGLKRDSGSNQPTGLTFSCGFLVP